MPPSDAARNSNTGQFSLCIEGLPTRYTWQDVKDLARAKAEHGIRADTATRHGRNGEIITIHVAKVCRRSEANRLYEWWTSERIEGRYLVVHFFDNGTFTKSNCRPPNSDCPVCSNIDTGCATNASNIAIPSNASCQMAVPAIPMYQHMTATMNPAYSVPAAPQYIMAPAMLSTPAQPQSRAQMLEAAIRSKQAAGSALTPEQQEVLRRMDASRLQSGQAPYVQPPAPPPVYVATRSGPPVNTSHGVAKTEIRGVFVQGLDFKAKPREVESLFAKAGEVVKCELHIDSKGKPKGSATIEYTTAAAATQAIGILHDFPWKGRFLRVRSDREAVVVIPPPQSNAASSSSRRSGVKHRDSVDQFEPTIVDGSGRRQQVK